MPLTVGQIAALPELELAVRTHYAALDRDVRWVAVSEHVDPTPWLAPGDLLLTTGLALDTHPDAMADYVRRLTDAGVAGIGFGTGLSHQEVPDALLAAADASGLPVFEVPEPVPFVAISKAVSRLLAAQEYAESTAAFDSQRRLLRAALSDGEPGASTEDQILGIVARHVGGFALLLDATGQPRAAHPRSAADRAPEFRAEVDRLGPRGMRGSSSLVTSTENISLLPVGVHGTAESFLVAGAPRPLRPADQGVLALAVSLLARPSGTGSRPDAWRDLLVRHATVAGLPTGLLAELGLLALTSDRAVGVVVRTTGPQAAATLGADRADLVLAPVHPVPADGVIWNGFAAVDADGRLAPVLDRLAGLPGVRSVGVSATLDLGKAANVRQALAQADDASRGRGLRRYGVEQAGSVADLLDAASASMWAHSYLDAVLVLDEGPELLATVRAWLEQHGQVDAAAQRLGVHRHTVRHRLRRAEAALGRSLDDPQVRADLWFALAALR